MAATFEAQKALSGDSDCLSGIVILFWCLDNCCQAKLSNCSTDNPLGQVSHLEIQNGRLIFGHKKPIPGYTSVCIWDRDTILVSTNHFSSLPEPTAI